MPKLLVHKQFLSTVFRNKLLLLTKGLIIKTDRHHTEYQSFYTYTMHTYVTEMMFGSFHDLVPWRTKTVLELIENYRIFLKVTLFM